MNAKIKKALTSGESETVEFKAGFDKNTIETLVAFANTRGGDVLIGVSDRGEIKGIQISKETVQNWINEVKQYTSQAIIPDAETIKIKDKNIVILSVQESPIKPVACKGRYYIQAHQELKPSAFCFRGCGHASPHFQYKLGLSY